jgi:signal transduction histidine kinase
MTAPIEKRLAFRHRLSVRHAFFSVLVAIVVGLMFSLGEFVADLDDERDRVDEAVRLIVSVVKEPAAAAAYSIDTALAKRIADGVVAGRGMLEVGIDDDFGHSLGASARPPDRPRLTVLAPYLIKPLPPYDVALVRSRPEGGSLQVGTLHILTDSGVILSNLLGNSSRLLLLSMVRAVVLAAAFALLFHYLTTRALLGLAAGFAEVKPDQPIRRLLAVPGGHEQDELGIIVRAANDLITAFQRSLEERDRVGEELRQLTEVLELRVQQRTREAVEKSILLGATLEAMDEGLSVIDGESKLTLWNSKFVTMFELPNELAAAGAPIASLIRHSIELGDRPCLPQGGDWIAETDSHDPDRLPCRWTRKTGMAIDIRRSRMVNGGIVTTYTDVTRQAQFEEELRSAKERAEQALEDLRQAQAELVQAEKMASLAQLVGGIAHEINTPIGVAFTAASHFEEKTKDVNRLFASNALRKSDLTTYIGTASEAANFIATNLGRAADLIQSFKKVAIDQASEARRSFELSGYLGQIVQSLIPILKKVPHRVEIDCPSEIVMDSYPGALSQILTNLIMNSLAHAFENVAAGHMRISARTEGDKAIIDYSDDGCGIAPENMKKVFEPFFTTRRGRGGSGLGLHIVFNLVTAMLKGQIVCKSEPGQGVRFTMTMPVTVE